VRDIWRSAAAAVAAVLGAAVVAAVGTELAQPASASAYGSIDPATVFYVPTNDQVSQWVRNNPNDSRMPVIRDRIASQSQAIWFANYSPSTVTSDVSAVMSAAAAAAATPVLAVYEIPNRDCGGASAGGAPDIPSYESWAQKFAAGLGSHQAIIILEPDSLALQSCLSAQQISDRDAALAYAAQAIHAADPAAKVYMDAGHSNWNSPADQASRLAAAQVASAADGIFSNASNFMYTSDELSYDKAVLAALGNPSKLHIVIDTSRNGNGPAPGDPWCDPSGRALGQVATAATGDAAVDAYLWVKAPGESDGCVAGAGTFVPDLAYALATNPTSTTSPSPTSTTSPTPTTSSSTPAPSGSFQLSLQAVSPNPTQVGQATNITVGFKNTASSTASNVTLTIGVYDSTGAKVGGQSWTGQTLGSQQLISETYGWQPATGGTYTVGATVTDASGTTLASNTNTGTATVQ
jgi:endoglucanase